MRPTCLEDWEEWRRQRHTRLPAVFVCPAAALPSEQRAGDGTTPLGERSGAPLQVLATLLDFFETFRASGGHPDPALGAVTGTCFRWVREFGRRLEPRRTRLRAWNSAAHPDVVALRERWRDGLRQTATALALAGPHSPT